MNSSLSSLNFLSQDGRARPKSKDNQRGILPIVSTEEKNQKEDNGSAFKDFPDYSKLNAQRHNASRSDTFKTAASPLRKKRDESTIMSSDDMSAVNFSYLISGIRHEVREIGKDIKAEIQEDMQQSLLSMRKDVQSTLDIVSDTRDSTVGVVLTKLTEGVTQILADVGWPIKVDFTPILEGLAQSELARGKSNQDMVQQLEDRLAQNIGLVMDKFEEMQKCEEKIKTELGQQDEHLNSVQQELACNVDDIKKTIYDARDAEQVHWDASHDLGQRIQADIRQLVRSPVNSEFSQVKEHIQALREGDCLSFETLSKEINRMANDVAQLNESVNPVALAKALDIDYDKPKVSLDEIWTQTDVVETSHGFAQTDDKMWRAKVPNSKDKGSHDKHAKHGKHAHGRASTVDLSRNSRKPVKKNEVERSVFCDAEQMKKRARQALIRVQYNVQDYYYSKGFAQKIAKSQGFENITFAAVALNAIWISIDADHNDASLLMDAHPLFIIVENGFCTFFCFELACRFFAFRSKRRCLRDYWFVFDLILVILMVMETWVVMALAMVMGLKTDANTTFDANFLKLLKMVKILRLSRLVRLMRAVPEIVVFLRGFGAASRSVLSLFGLWTIVIYVFAVFFVQTIGDESLGSDFESVPNAMSTLLVDGILPQNAPIINMVVGDHPIMWPMILAFVLIASITLSYMLIGVLVHIIHAIAIAEKEKLIVGIVANRLRSEWQDRGFDPDSLLSQQEFQNLLIEPSVALFLQEVGVDVLVLVDMSDMIYEDISKEQSGLGFEAFVDAILNMRGSNPVTVQDMKSQLKILKRLVNQSVLALEQTLTVRVGALGKQVKKMKKVMQGFEDLEDSSDSGSGGSGGSASEYGGGVQKINSRIEAATKELPQRQKAHFADSPE